MLHEGDRDARQEQQQLEALHRLDEECVHLQRTGDYLQAFDCMERALVLRRHLFGAESPEVRSACKSLAEMCNLLSMSFLQQDNYAVTIELLKKAEILAQHHPKEKATTLNNLACYYRRLGKLHTAMTCLKQALAIEKKTLKDTKHAADTHLNMCAVLSQLGKHQEALQHAQAALVALQEEFFNKAPVGGDARESDTSVASAQLDRVSVMCIAYHNIGVEQEFLKDYESSVLSYKKGVGLAEQYLGVDHAIATTIRNSYLAAKRTISTKATNARHGATSPAKSPLGRAPVSPRAMTPPSSLRLPTPVSPKDRVERRPPVSPRSIVADALARGNTLPPLAMTKSKKAALSPEDPFFSPRFRFDGVAEGEREKLAPKTTPQVAQAEVTKEPAMLSLPSPSEDHAGGPAADSMRSPMPLEATVSPSMATEAVVTDIAADDSNMSTDDSAFVQDQGDGSTTPQLEEQPPLMMESNREDGAAEPEEERHEQQVVPSHANSTAILSPLLDPLPPSSDHAAKNTENAEAVGVVEARARDEAGDIVNDQRIVGDEDNRQSLPDQQESSYDGVVVATESTSAAGIYVESADTLAQGEDASGPWESEHYESVDDTRTTTVDDGTVWATDQHDDPSSMDDAAGTVLLDHESVDMAEPSTGMQLEVSEERTLQPEESTFSSDSVVYAADVYANHNSTQDQQHVETTENAPSWGESFAAVEDAEAFSVPSDVSIVHDTYKEEIHEASHEVLFHEEAVFDTTYGDQQEHGSLHWAQGGDIQPAADEGSYDEQAPLEYTTLERGHTEVDVEGAEYATAYVYDGDHPAEATADEAAQVLSHEDDGNSNTDTVAVGGDPHDE